MSLIKKLNKDYKAIRCMKNIRYRSDIGNTSIVDKTGKNIKFLDIIQYSEYSGYFVVYAIKNNNIILVDLDRLPLEIYIGISIKRFLENKSKIDGNFEDEYNLWINKTGI